jgi:hypothetical protein
MLSTPSLGITVYDEIGNGIVEECFQLPLSGSRDHVRAVALQLGLTDAAFNSLSRDHGIT